MKFTFYSSSGPSDVPEEGEETKAKREEHDPICPSCKKNLSNSVLMFRTSARTLHRISLLNIVFRLVMKPCAHVTCKTCTDSLVRPAKQCVVCDKQLKDTDIIELKREGARDRNFILANLQADSFTGTRDWICGRRTGRDFEGRYILPRMSVSWCTPCISTDP